MRIWIWAAALAMVACLGIAPAFADDWTAVKLRGAVLELVDGEWQPLKRGDVVPDEAVIKTRNGRVTLARGEEMIALGRNTQVQIVDAGGRRPFTTVKQYFGTVEIEAEVQNVEHFAVATPYLVAVVKGTRFTVSSDRRTSKVSVRRGAVSVLGLESGTETLIVAGQSASTRGHEPLRVSGIGQLPEVVVADPEAAKNNGIDLAGSNGNAGGNNGNASNNGNGNGVSVGVGNGNGNGVNVGVGVGNGNGNGNGANVDVNAGGGGGNVNANVGNDASVGVEAGNGNGNGVGVGVSVGNVSVGLGLGG